MTEVPTALLEIIEVAQGRVVLRRADGRGDPLIEVSFSTETLSYMNDVCLDVAKVMIQAGIAAVASGDSSVEFIDSSDNDNQTLH